MSNRLDALKARVRGVTIWTSNADADYVSRLQQDIERLVAVVEAYLSDKVDSTDPGYPRTDTALAYWLEEKK